MDRNYENSETEANLEVTQTVSRKRQSGSDLKKTRACRAAKQLRIMSSSEESNEDSGSSDNEDNFKIKRKVVSSDESSDEDVKIKMEGSDFELESESEDSEYEDSGDSYTLSDDSDSDYGKKKSAKKGNQMTRIGGKSIEHLSKVQQHIIKQYNQNSAASTKNTLPGRHRNEIIESVRSMKDELLQKIEDLGERLPKVKLYSYPTNALNQQILFFNRIRWTT